MEEVLANSRKITDPDVKKLESAAKKLRPSYKNYDSEWKGSPFSWIRSHSSSRRGKIGRHLVSNWLEARGFTVEPSGKHAAIFIVNDVLVQIKFSMLWKAGNYKFQQIKDQDYQLLMCLGVSPFEAHAWVFTKEFLFENWGELEGFKPQHSNDTAWIDVNPASPHEWIEEHGGALRTAFSVLSTLLNEQQRGPG